VKTLLELRAYRLKYVLKVRHTRIKKYKDDLGAKCALCGYSQNYASLDFHHLRDKRFPVNTSAMQKPLELIEEEIKKCVLLCRNCHNDIHHPVFSIDPAKTLDSIQRLKCQS